MANFQNDSTIIRVARSCTAKGLHSFFFKNFYMRILVIIHGELYHKQKIQEAYTVIKPIFF